MDAPTTGEEAAGIDQVLQILENIAIEGRRVNRTLDAIESRMGNLEEHQNNFDVRMYRLVESISDVQSRIGRMEERFGRLEERMGRVEERFARLEDSLSQDP